MRKPGGFRCRFSGGAAACFFSPEFPMRPEIHRFVLQFFSISAYLRRPASVFFLKLAGCLKSIVVFCNLVDSYAIHLHALLCAMNVGTINLYINAFRVSLHSAVYHLSSCNLVVSYAIYLHSSLSAIDVSAVNCVHKCPVRSVISLKQYCDPLSIVDARFVGTVNCT